MIRVVVAENQALIRESFARLIDAHPDMRVIAAVGDGAGAVRHAAGADVVVMDIRMPIMDGIEATRRIVRGVGSTGSAGGAASPRPKVLVLTTFREEDLVLGALDAGASGFLLKDSDPAELLSAIARIHRGEGVLDPKVTPMVLRHITHAGAGAGRGSGRGSGHGSGRDANRSSGRSAGHRAAQAELPDFTPREREILGLVCEGLSNDEIARRLFVATTTVKSHVKSLLTKTGSRGRVDLVIWAARRGLV
ncbi:response regulator transcription factor [Corynebacterium lactis]|uniref:LuxR family transcriptional regulator n=1 Tax=Corynebacterium lactis RW2-5 TaxID=1408189 RepID=A0A0K2GXW0_9CORY|nr:response regulator transcription factor [Corynebacterium lactis]ALA66634.1 LuxR family transcriptional regulator [Corynebacterium lactis RW2-5]